MDRLNYFVGRHFPEICALLASAVVLAVGAYLAWNFAPVWLNRAGALVIIIGVLLAASRFHEWIVQKIIDSIEENPETILPYALRVYERRAGVPLSEEQRASFLSTAKEELLKNSTLKEELVKHASSLIEPDKRRIRLWEIYLVIAGTFLNGFGDYIVSLLKGNGT